MRVQRVRADDILTKDGETALLLDGHLVRLGALSAAIHSLTEASVDIEELAATLEADFGAPASGTALEATKDAVAELIRHGVLAVVP